MLTRNEYKAYHAKHTEYANYLKENKTEFCIDNWWFLETMNPQVRGNFMEATHAEKMNGLLQDP